MACGERRACTAVRESLHCGERACPAMREHALLRESMPCGEGEHAW